MTNQELIDRALSALSIIEAGDSANSTDSATALDELNTMMAEWKVNDKDLQWPPQDTLSDTAPIPSWAENAVINVLAVRLAPEFNFPLTIELANKAESGENTVMRTLMNLKLEGADLSYLPLGENRSRYDITTDT